MSKRKQSKSKTISRDYIGKKQYRTFEVQARAIDEDSRTVEIAFSSETPVERFFGTEILDHAPQSVRLDRLNGGGAVLVNHNIDDQVGVVDRAKIDDDRVGRAVTRFSRSQRGQEIFVDVQDDIRQLVSVGYTVHKFEETKKEGGGVELRATDWEPIELSFVSIPADVTVGVGRSVEGFDEDDLKRLIEQIDEERQKIDQQYEGKKMAEEQQNGETRNNTAPNQGINNDPPFDAKAERERVRTEEMNRVNQIRAMASEHGYDDIGTRAIEEGTSYEDFKGELLQEIGKRNNKVRSESDFDGNLDVPAAEKKRYSFTNLMRALANPQDRSAQKQAAFELEVSTEAEKRFGGDFQVRGAFIPDEMLMDGMDASDLRRMYGTMRQRAMHKDHTFQRDLSAGTATDGAELVATDLLAGSFIDVLRNSMVTAQAGVRMLPGLVGDVDIPRKTSGASATWISAEDGDATQSDPQFDQVSLSPKDLAAYTQVTRRLLQQSTPAIEGIVRSDLAVAIALGLDLAVLYGSGASGQPTGVSNQTGINTTTFAAADPTYAEVIGMVKETMLDNALMGNLAFIIDPQGWEALMTTEKASGTAQFIMQNGTVVGYQAYTTNQVTAEDYFFGNWADVLVGEWGGVELNVDPYTHSLKGKVRYVIFKSSDIGVRHPTSFCYSNDTP